MKTVVLVSAYLAAIVAANLITAAYGFVGGLITSPLFIGLDLACRDALHDAWGRHRVRNMGVLILAGSAISYAVNRDAGVIALASCIAFACSATVDGLVYHARRHRPWLVRSNQSSIAGAAVDSAVFPFIAFGALAPLYFAIDWTTKTLGAAAWSIALQKVRSRG